MKSLITGGAGFIGSHLTRELIRQGHEVVVLDDLSGGFRENVPETAVELVVGSIVDHELVEGLFAAHEFDYVYHLAAYAAEGLSHYIRRFNYTNNVIGSANLINASVRHEVKHFVFTSSMAVYGEGELPFKESQVPCPVDPYGIAKTAVEQDLAAAHTVFGLPYTIFRPHNVYGEYQNIADRYRNVVGIFMNQIMGGEPLTIFGDGTQTRAFSYVGDFISEMARAVTISGARNEIFNVGGDRVYPISELAHAVCDAAGVDSALEFLPPRHEVAHAYSDHTKFNHVFGLAPRTPLEEGLARMWEWAKARGKMPTTRFAEIELVQGIPTHWTR